VYACIRKEMGIVFSVLIVVQVKRGASLCVRPLSSRVHLSRELLGEALLLGPLVVVGGSVLFEDLDVLGDEILAAVGADGHGLRGLDGSTVLVDLDAGASSVGLLVLALDTVLLGDRHGEGWLCGCCCAYCRVVGERWDSESWEIPELERAKTLLSQGNFSRSSFDHGRQIIQYCHMRPREL
jgi:hypothetical protein